MPQPLAQGKDIDAAFGRSSRARMCLNHTNRLTQWTKQINNIEEKNMRMHLEQLDRKRKEEKDREDGVRKRLADSVERMQAKRTVLRHHPMLEISDNVKGGDFQVAIAKFLDAEIAKAVAHHSLSRRRAKKMRRRFERSRDDFLETVDRLTAMDLSIKPHILQSRLVGADAEGTKRGSITRFRLPFLMLNTMVASRVQEERYLSEKEREQLFAAKLDHAYDREPRRRRGTMTKSPTK